MAPGNPADKKNNVLPLWGNEKTMNLNNLILTNILSSPYFKVNLYKLKTYHEVVDEIYYNVSSYLFPFLFAVCKVWQRVATRNGSQDVSLSCISL